MLLEFGNYQISANKAALVKMWWAEPDSDRRPLARKANVLTRLDDRPTRMFDKRTTLVNIRILFLEAFYLSFAAYKKISLQFYRKVIDNVQAVGEDSNPVSRGFFTRKPTFF